MKSCLSCSEARPYSPKCCRSKIRYRCSVYLFDVDAGCIPGETVGCQRFNEPEIPFAFDDMPAHLL